MRSPCARRLLSVLCLSAAAVSSGCRRPEPAPQRHPSAYVLQTLTLEMPASSWEAVEAAVDRNTFEVPGGSDHELTTHPPLELALGEERAVDLQRRLSDMTPAGHPPTGAVAQALNVGLLIKATLRAVDHDHAVVDVTYHDSRVIGWEEDASGARFPELSLVSWESPGLELPLDRWQLVSGSSYGENVVRQLLRVNSPRSDR